MEDLREFSFNFDLNYYTNKENIANQDLVAETINYFELGEGKRAFRTLEFLNLLEKQYQFIIANVKDSEKVISHLKALPLSTLKSHILFGLLLKWFGGYPVHNSNDDYNATLKHIQNEFLQFEEETPEKEFCKADFEQRNHFMKLGIALTTAINNNIDAKLVFDAMDITQNQQRKYNNFDKLFDAVAISGRLGEFKNQHDYILIRSRYHFEFNVWLQEIKAWEYGNDLQYKSLLTVELFNEYLDCARNKAISKKSEEQKKGTEMEFDLKKYDLTTANVWPYFPEPKFDGSEYRIYEGATGNNRFQYFKVYQKSNAGKLCKQFVEKYYSKNEKRIEYYDEGEKLIEACKIDAIDKVIGLDAYLKYWNDCLTENDKLINNIYSIQHFEALKEWFNLTVEKHIQKNETHYLNEDVENADIEQYKESIADSVSKYLKQSERTGERKFSAISKVKANELIKFYYWIKEQNEKAPNNSEIKTEQLKSKPNRTKELIEKEFENIKDSCFHSNDEYNTFLELLINFFEGNPYGIPIKTINLKRGSKTKIATVFNPIHKALIMSDIKLKSDTEYLKIIKVLNHFSNKSNADIYKAITR